jgi:hypothetical protein
MKILKTFVDKKINQTQNVFFLLFFHPDLEPAFGRVKNTNHASLTSEERGR